jgi:hypothetical protein
VLVRTEESFDGLVVRLFSGPMRRMFASWLQKGLSTLRQERIAKARDSAMLAT